MNDSDKPDVLELLVGDYGNPGQPTIRPLRSIADLQSVYRLTHECYVASGYCAPHPSGLTIHYPYFDHIAETTTLVACLHGEIVGSISLTVDGPAGLSVDEDFREDCDSIRQEGLRVGAIWRLVVNECVRSKRTVVIKLMEAMIGLLLEKNVTTALFAVNPKHESVYRQMLNAAAVAHHEKSEGLSAAPAILLRFNPARLPKGSVLSPAKRNFIFLHELLRNRIARQPKAGDHPDYRRISKALMEL